MASRSLTSARAWAVLATLAFTLLLASLAGAQSAAAASYSERVLSRPELLSYWRLGETSGVTAVDLKSARNGTYVGGVALNQVGALPADPDKAARFDGIDDSVTLPTLPSATNFTIEGWQNITAGAGSNNTLYGGVSGARLMPRPAGFYVDAVAGTRFALQGTTATNTGVWVHWALVRSGATLTLYRNGLSVASRSDLPAATPTDLSGQIGRLVAAYPSKATIDDVSVYTRALTQLEVAGDFASRIVAPTGGDPPPPPPPAGPFYVDRGSRGGACSDARTAAQAASAATPWCSIEKASHTAPDGATVLVRAATYPAVSIDGSVNGAMLTFKPYASEQPVLDGLAISSSSNLRFQGFAITDVTDLSQATMIQIVGNDISPHDIRVVSGSDLLIEANTIHDLTMDRGSDGACIQPRCGYGVRVSAANNLTIRGNTFRHIPADGIQSGYATNVLIENNVFDDITPFVDPNEHSDSIQFYSGSDHLTIRANAFRHTRGPLLGDPGATLPQRNLVIENNILVDQTDWALKIYNAPRLKLLNNTIWDARLGVVLGDNAQIAEKTSATALNNIIDALSAPAGVFTLEDYNIIATGPRLGSHDTNLAPTFVNEAALDYRLASGSRGIDAGTSDATPDHDQAGNARLDSSAVPNTGGGAKPYYELGALEFLGSGTPPPPPPTGSYPTRILALPSLLAYWRLGESSGTVADDAKGTRDGAYANGVTLGTSGAISGDPDTAASFDGVNDQVTLPALPSSVDFTIEGWVRLSAGAATNNGLYGATGTLRFMPRPSGFYAGVYLGGTEYILQGTPVANTGIWVHWALVRSGATLTVYRNGVKAAERTDLPAATAATLTGSIGRIGPSYPTKGAIDDVAVYSTALGAGEIAAHSGFGAG